MTFPEWASLNEKFPLEILFRKLSNSHFDYDESDWESHFESHLLKVIESVTLRIVEWGRRTLKVCWEYRSDSSLSSWESRLSPRGLLNPDSGLLSRRGLSEETAWIFFQKFLCTKVRTRNVWQFANGKPLQSLMLEGVLRRSKQRGSRYLHSLASRSAFALSML